MDQIGGVRLRGIFIPTNGGRKRLEDHDYKSFISILSVYRKENKDIKEVYHEVAIILNEHPDLLDECTMFLLNSSTNLDNNKTLMRLHKEQKTTRAEKENMGKRTHIEDYEEQVEDALKHTHVKEFTFCEKVKERVRSRADYQAFLKCLYIYSKEIITREQLQRLVANTLAKYPELMEGFNEFIERYERVVGFLAKWDEEQDKDQDEASPQRINLEQVVTFVKKVKERFQHDDHV
nr:paired amphipathic helix protein Sin3-like 4 [Solanum lycopersicum]